MGQAKVSRTVSTLLIFASITAVGRSVEAAEVTLNSGTEDVALDPAQSKQLAASLDSYFEACHPYAEVIGGEDLPQDRLASLWSEQERLPHAVLRRDIGGRDPGPGGDETLDVLFGFTSQGGPGPVLSRARDSARTVTSYIKCPGLEGLLLSCRVHALIPGMTPSARCGEWAALAAEQVATPIP
jgi:hypothetical protein